MSSFLKSYFTYGNTFTEPNAKLKKKKNIFHKLDYNEKGDNNYSQFLAYKKNIVNTNENKSFISNSNFNVTRKTSKIKNKSFSFASNQRKIFSKKKAKFLENYPINDTSLSKTNNLTTNETSDNNNLFWKESNHKNNINNFNITNDFTINKLINNKIYNNRLRLKFDRLLELSIKNNNNNKIIRPIIEESKKLAKLEMTIDKIRNKNRKEIFKT